MGQRELSPALLMLQAMGAFKRIPAGSFALDRSAREPKKVRVIARTGHGEAARRQKQIAKGRIPDDQRGRIDNDRVVPL